MACFHYQRLDLIKPNYILSMKIEVYKPTWESWEFNFLPMILLQQFEKEYHLAVGWLCWTISLEW